MEWGMDSILLVDGFHGMGHGFHTFSRWIPYFFHGMGDGLHTFSRWIPWGEGWTPHFFKMDSMEWGMDSILFQDGIHGMGDGLNNFFYLFHKSRLKIYMVGN